MSNQLSPKKIIIFYSISISVSWMIGLLIITGVILDWCHYLTAFGPMLAALFIRLNDKSLPKLKRDIGIKQWRWLIFGGASPIWVSGAIVFVIWLMNRSLPSLSLLGQVSFLGQIGFLSFLLWLFTFGIGEEIGWRGFLLPELLKKLSLLTSTIVVWLLWLLWHLPMFFYVPNYLDMNIVGIIGYAFSLFSGAVLLSWLYDKSNHSLSTVILFHACFDFITASAFGQGSIAMILSMVVIGASIIIVFSWLRQPTKKQEINGSF